MDKELKVEDILNRIDQIVEDLDNADEPLDDLLKKYEEAMYLAKSCRKYLNEAEQKVIDISKDINEDDDTNE